MGLEALGFWMKGAGFWVEGLGFRVKGLGSRVCKSPRGTIEALGTEYLKV